MKLLWYYFLVPGLFDTRDSAVPVQGMKIAMKGFMVSFKSCPSNYHRGRKKLCWRSKRVGWLGSLCGVGGRGYINNTVNDALKMVL